MPDPDLPDPFRWEGEHVTAELPGARVLFSSRRGGVSEGPFASLNLGRLTADDGANVDANRERLAAAVGHPRERFLYGRQVHGADVRRATEPPGAARPAADEDGQATVLDDAPALVFVADCLPVLLAAGDAVAALHCGWHGLRKGIVAEGVRALRDAAALVFVADCLPVMLVTDGGVAALHCGRRPIAAVTGPAPAAAATRSARRSRRRSPTSRARAWGSATSTCRASRATGWRRPASGPSTTPGCARCAPTSSSRTGATTA